MIVDYLAYRMPEERAGEFATAFEGVARHLQKSPYCLKYEVGRSVGDGGGFVIRLELGSRPGRADLFDESPAGQALQTALQPFDEFTSLHLRVDVEHGEWEKP